jgi:hypothetical protein
MTQNRCGGCKAASCVTYVAIGKHTLALYRHILVYLVTDSHSQGLLKYRLAYVMLKYAYRCFLMLKYASARRQDRQGSVTLLPALRGSLIRRRLNEMARLFA